MSAGKRAAGQVRRYAIANRLDRLVTLTYRKEPRTRGQAVEHAMRFLEDFAARFGRRPLVWVLEQGEEHGRLHLHLALNFFVAKAVLGAIWGRGWVDIRRQSDRGSRWELRKLGGYLAKYVSKTADEVPADTAKDRAEGEHRYGVTQGFSPRCWNLRYARVGQAYERMRGLYGQPNYEFPFGDWSPGGIFGIWYAFPDHLLHPNRA